MALLSVSFVVKIMSYIKYRGIRRHTVIGPNILHNVTNIILIIQYKDIFLSSNELVI